MRRPVVLANWKMNGSAALVDQMIRTLSDAVPDGVDVVVVPPALYVSDMARGFAGSSVSVGVQNVSDRDAAALTGEMSARMARECGATFALVGHSERRQLFAETDTWIAAKFAAIAAAGMVPVLCVGETLDERRAQRAETVVVGQLAAVIDGVGVGQLAEAVVAYEPVWAIGTGETASPEQAQAMHAVIRGYLAEVDRGLAGDMRILYGGSVKPENAGTLFQQPDIDGGLVGGASLEAEGFLKICEAAG